MQVGRELIVFNGEGGEYDATIVAVTKKHASLKLGEYRSQNAESPLQTHLAIALSRGERFDFVLQKATELGVTQITPLFTERTEVKLQGERRDKKLNSWQKLIIAACEQCGRNLLPTLNTPVSINEFLNATVTGSKFVLHHRNSERLSKERIGNAVNLLIGPEGGLTEVEINAAHLAGYENLALGPRVLRTETAPLAALTLLQHYAGDL